MCEDPFHNNYTTDILERPCMGGRKNRNGLFPAAACIKVVGTYCKKPTKQIESNDQWKYNYILMSNLQINIPYFLSFLADGSGTIMIRGCSLDSGTLTTDTELVRMSHCGSFFFNEK